jgi:hypothetical protein
MAYNTQKVFPCSSSLPVIIAVYVGTGKVTIEKPVGDFWVPADVITADGASPYWLGGGSFRVTPTGTAQYEVS